MFRNPVSRLAGWILVMLLVVGCREPFDLKIQGEETGFLVVEGYVNLGTNAVTTIRLTRTSRISDSLQLVTEGGAAVTIEDEIGNSYSLTDKGTGIYESGVLSLSGETKFRLSIQTQEGKQYYSQFQEPLITPAIDSVVWMRNNDGVGIYVSTKDPDNKVKYYQWDHEEVWEIWSAYHSFYEFKNNTLVPRPDAEILARFKCWKYDHPQSFLMESTADKTVSEIPMKRIIQIPAGAEKFTFKYSVLVKQHALSRSAFEYLQMMEKSSTAVGSYFDPLPSELDGNIYCTTGEPVVGFVGAYTTSEVRIFIRYFEVPDWNFELTCELIGVGNNPATWAEYFGPGRGYVPTSSNGAGSYFASTPACTDCRLRNGTNIRPPFW
jgi:hypothetical protein